MPKPPAFQFYVRDWLTDKQVRLMGMEGEGLYIRLMAHQWLEGSVPSDAAGIAALIGRPLEDVERVWPKVKPCFQGEAGDGEVFNIRLNDQREEYERKRRLAAKAGRASGRARRKRESESPDDTTESNGRSTNVHDPLERNGNTAVATAVANRNASNEAGEPGVENLALNARFAPLAKQLGQNRSNAGRWIRWAKGRTDHDRAERIMLGTLSLRDRGAMEHFVEPGAPCAPGVLSTLLEGQPIVKYAEHEYQRITRDDRRGPRQSSGLDPLSTEGVA